MGGESLLGAVWHRHPADALHDLPGRASENRNHRLEGNGTHRQEVDATAADSRPGGSWDAWAGCPCHRYNLAMPKGEYLQYGGQAIIEGVMMRSPNFFSVACRA